MGINLIYSRLRHGIKRFFNLAFGLKGRDVSDSIWRRRSRCWRRRIECCARETANFLRKLSFFIREILNTRNDYNRDNVLWAVRVLI